MTNNDSKNAAVFRSIPAGEMFCGNDEIEKIPFVVPPKSQIFSKANVRLILSCLEGTSFHDFLVQLLVSGSIANNIGTASHVVVYKADLPYKEFLVNCHPNIESKIELGADVSYHLLIDWFDIAVNSPVKNKAYEWIERKYSLPSIFLLPPQMRVNLARFDLMQSRFAPLQLPEDMKQELCETLKTCGVDEAKSQICLSLEGGNSQENNDFYLERLEDFANDHNCQIILISGNIDNSIPKAIIDLRDAEFALKAAAISQSKLMTGRVCAFLTLAAAFGRPVIAFESTDFEPYLWHEQDRVIAQEKDPSGESLWETLKPLLKERLKDQKPKEDHQNDPPYLTNVSFPLGQETSPKPKIIGPLQKAEQNQKNVYLKKNKRKVIAAFLGHQTLGDFMSMNYAATLFAQAFPERELLLIYRDDRSYKNFLARLNPLATAILPIPNDPKSAVPVDWFFGTEGACNCPFPQEWYERGLHNPDIFLTPYALDVSIGAHGQPIPKFKIPPEVAPTLAQALTTCGLKKDKWFVTLHIRQAGYEHRKHSSHDADPRNADPMSYLPMIVDIIKKLGGQVVRIGDPSNSPFPQMEGLVDLSQIPNSVELQAFAVSRSRYFIASDSGPILFGIIFGVPTAKTNAILKGVGENSVLVPKWFLAEDNRRYNPLELEKAGYYTFEKLFPKNIKYAENDPEDLVEASRYLFDQTTEVEGWREQPAQEALPHRGFVEAPFSTDWQYQMEVWSRFDFS